MKEGQKPIPKLDLSESNLKKKSEFGMNDDLLKGLTNDQKSHIIKSLYPSFKDKID